MDNYKVMTLTNEAIGLYHCPICGVSVFAKPLSLWQIAETGNTPPTSMKCPNHCYYKNGRPISGKTGGKRKPNKK